jgi:hypothetical protein
MTCVNHGVATTFLSICILLFADFPRHAVVVASEARQYENTTLSSLGIPTVLRPQWRKFGLWDFKQTDSKYRDFTKFHFGATGTAAKVPEQQLLAWASASRPTPADLEFITSVDLDNSFATRRKQLEELRTMVEADHTLVRIAADFTWLTDNTKWPRPNIGLSAKRWQEYRDLFRDVGLQEGVLRSANYPGAIFFIVHARGIVTGGAGVGYVCSESQLAPLTQSPREDLDAIARASVKKGSATVFRKLAERWYAFYQLDW